MIPIRQLLNRIRWDPQFGQGEFVIGYYDRLSETQITAPFKSLHFFQGNTFSFGIIDEQGIMQTIPFHRVRRVFKNGECIWSRAITRGESAHKMGQQH